MAACSPWLANKEGGGGGGREGVHQSNLEGLSDADALDAIARLIDAAGDEIDLTLIEQALAMADQLEARGLRPEEQALLDYFRSNGWACRYQCRYLARDAHWDFEQPEIQQQILLLRRAAHGAGFGALDAIRRCQILTNLGNQLDALGRFVEARSCWNVALSIEPRFWMARANRGNGLMFYAAALYDPGHQGVFAYRAYGDLVEAVELIDKYPQLGDSRLREVFEPAAEQILLRYDLEAIHQAYRPDDGSLGAGPAEQEYRRWCLTETLFLNPLNDVDAAPIAARDVLCLPSFVLPAGEPPFFTGMFNELKQLFASARLLLWEGLQGKRDHFSDRDVVLLNTLDYPSYGLSVEKVKAAFRLGYSIFDKIAYFLNHYLGLGLVEHRISFRTIWREKDTGPLREPIAMSENWPLRGLYWLSKDLFEEGMRGSTEPQARALAELRNHLEHKYVKVHEFSVPATRDGDPLRDRLAYSLTRSDLNQKTLRLLQLVRSALVYLSLAMHHEERRRAKRLSGLSAPMLLDVWRDEWKR